MVQVSARHDEVTKVCTLTVAHMPCGWGLSSLCAHCFAGVRFTGSHATQPPVTLHCTPRQVHELRAVRLACDRILASPVSGCAMQHLESHVAIFG